MKVDEFYREFANTSLEKRFNVINITKYGTVTLYDLYKGIKSVEAQIAPLQENEDKILKIAEEYFELIKKDK